MATTLRDPWLEVSAHTLQDKSDSFSVTALPATLKKRLTFAVGTAADKVDRAYFKEYTIDPSQAQDIDLDAAITNILGDSAAAANGGFVRGFAIVNVTATAGQGDCTLTGDWLDDWGGATGVTIPLGQGAVLAWGDGNGVVVTASTGDVVTVTNTDGSNAATIRVVFFVTSA